MTNKYTRDERCIGCQVHHDNCQFIAAMRIDKCPCIECLVKVVCNEEAEDCKQWRHFVFQLKELNLF
jgi:hypothetical protein